MEDTVYIMANQLEITTVYEGGNWLVTSKVADGHDEDFATDIFLWTLDSLGALDAFQAIGQLDQVTRYPLYDSNRTSNFGIHLVRYSESTQRLTSEEDVDKVIIVLKSAFSRLTDGYDVAKEPIVELYPATV